MNLITLTGIIKNIEHSHEIGDVLYDKALLYVNNELKASEDVIPVKFKSLTNNYKDGLTISISGNVRTYSVLQDDNKSICELYVFTYMDVPEYIKTNECVLDGCIIKTSGLIKTSNKKDTLLFILHNIIDVNGKLLHSYIPCTCFGSVAKKLSDVLKYTKVEITGSFLTRTYVKHLENNESEIRIAREIVVSEVDILV